MQRGADYRLEHPVWSRPGQAWRSCWTGELSQKWAWQLRSVEGQNTTSMSPDKYKANWHQVISLCASEQKRDICVYTYPLTFTHAAWRASEWGRVQGVNIFATAIKLKVIIICWEKKHQEVSWLSTTLQQSSNSSSSSHIIFIMAATANYRRFTPPGPIVCAKCHDEIDSERSKAFKAGSRFWHEHHFTCSECGIRLKDAKVKYCTSKLIYCLTNGHFMLPSILRSLPKMASSFVMPITRSSLCPDVPSALISFWR